MHGFTLRLPLIASVCASLPLVAAAQTAPDAGQAIQGIDSQPLQLPQRQRLELNLPDTPGEDAPASGPSLHVTGYVLEGNQAISTEALQAALSGLSGRTLTLGELQGAANRITRLYRQRGYPLARAYLPAQEIDGGVVRIVVLEGRIGQVEINDKSGLRGAALASLRQLRSGQAVRSSDLERSLLLLQATPGVDVRSTLRPGATTGETDLVIDVVPGRGVSGSMDADNHGNRYTGQYRLNGALNVHNPLNLGDRLSLRVMGTSEEQYYGRVAWQLPVGPWGTQLGAAYSDLAYELGKDFSDLDAHGAGAHRQCVCDSSSGAFAQLQPGRTAAARRQAFA